MNADMTAKLRRSLINHEGYSKIPYVDSVGKITIGIGYNLTDRGIDDEWINNQFLQDINYFYKQLLFTFEWYKDLSIDRQIVLIDMAFMGWKKFIGFKKMIDALSAEDYKQAAFEILESKWADQVKGRAVQLSYAMLTGVYDI